MRLCSATTSSRKALEVSLSPAIWACVMLTYVGDLSGRMHDLNCVTRWARAVGAAPVHLGQAAPEFAVGCGYKQGAKVT